MSITDAQSLVDRLNHLVDLRPDALFLDGSRRLTYRETATEVTQLKQVLAATAQGLPVVISGSNTANWVLHFLAARATGLVVIPVSTEAPAELWNELGDLIGPFYFVDTDVGEGHIINPDATPYALPDRVGFGLPTSGSTGLPRCVLRSDRSLLAEGERYVHGLGYTHTDRILVALPLCHAFILGAALGGALAAGATLYLVPRFIPRTIQRLLREQQSSILPLVPATARLLCEAFRDGGPLPHGLRHIIIGAGPVSPELEHQVITQLGHRPARNYGSSETGATLGTDGIAVPDEVTGAALPGVEAAIVSEEGPGALFVRMAETFMGYLSADGIDTSRTSPDGWYSTGDLASSDTQGWITIKGRLGAGLRRGGRFIQPAEVEQPLRRHPKVLDAVILSERDHAGEDVVTAHIEHQAHQQVAIEELRQHLKPFIEAYKMPMVWHFYDQLPRTSGGKPDRSRLRSSTQPETDLNPTQ